MITLEDVCCPITLEAMQDPVLATDGHTYERSAIEDWFSRRNTSPRTGERLPVPTLFPNYSLRDIIARFRAACD